MVKQWRLGQSNQKELTQKGDEHREEKQSPRAEQHSKQSGVLPCRRRWLGWRRVGSVSTPTAQRWCRLTGCAATPLYGTATSFRTNPSLWTRSRYKPPRCSELAASASSPVDVVLGPGVVSQSPDNRCQCPVCHSASKWRLLCSSSSLPWAS